MPGPLGGRRGIPGHDDLTGRDMGTLAHAVLADVLPHVSSSIDPPTNTALYLASHLDNLLKDKDFRALMKEVESGKGPAKDTPKEDGAILLKEMKTLRDECALPTSTSAPSFWNLSSRAVFGHDTKLDSIEVLKSVYHFPEEAAHKIVTGEDT